jgi:hypothetical protein
MPRPPRRRADARRARAAARAAAGAAAARQGRHPSAFRGGWRAHAAAAAPGRARGGAGPRGRFVRRRAAACGSGCLWPRHAVATAVRRRRRSRRRRRRGAARCRGGAARAAPRDGGARLGGRRLRAGRAAHARHGAPPRARGASRMAGSLVARPRPLAGCSRAHARCAHRHPAGGRVRRRPACALHPHPRLPYRAHVSVRLILIRICLLGCHFMHCGRAHADLAPLRGCAGRRAALRTARGRCWRCWRQAT